MRAFFLCWLNGLGTPGAQLQDLKILSQAYAYKGFCADDEFLRASKNRKHLPFTLERRVGQLTLANSANDRDLAGRDCAFGPP